MADAARSQGRDSWRNEERSFPMKRLLIILAGLSVGIGLTAGVAMTGTTKTQHAVKAPAASTIIIRHQMRGCHSWAVNGGPSRAAQRTTLARGGTITFVDNDVMSHKLVQTRGPAVRYHGNPAMRHMSASVQVTFAKAGVYRFTTKPGDDYPGMAMKTIGEDNVLRLTVKVS
jgi:plastocyanin